MIIKKTTSLILLIIIFLSLHLDSQDIIDFQIKGIDDGIKTSRDQDYQEALIDAKMKALEMAGVEVKSETTVENYQVLKSYVETKSEALILPGMSITDIGYLEGGTYQVFVVGKVKTKGETLLDKRLRYVEDLFARNENSKAVNELNSILDNSNNDEIIEQALYVKIKYDIGDPIETYHKLKSYYPDGDFLPKAMSILAEEEKVRTCFFIETEIIYEFRREEISRKNYNDYRKGVKAVLIRNLTNCETEMRWSGGASYKDCMEWYGRNSKSTADYFYPGSGRETEPCGSNVDWMIGFNKDYFFDVRYDFYGHDFALDQPKRIEKEIKITTPDYDIDTKEFIVNLFINSKGEIIVKSIESIK